MPSDSTQNQSPTHHHAHTHDHAHAHHHSHGAELGHGSPQVPDLKSPVLIGVFQRLFWTGAILAGLWLVVYWALRTHG